MSFYIGVVEDILDPAKLGRTRVRIHGVHTQDKGLLPTEHLPWAMPIQSVQSAALLGIGQSPVGLLVGTVVFVVFIDGEEKQIPVVLGSIASINGSEADTPRRMRNENVALDQKISNIFSGIKDIWEEPADQYATKYPFNQNYTSVSGHIQEFDDTPQHERILTKHKTGSKIEFLQDGSVSKKVVNDNFDIVLNNSYAYVKGNGTLTIDGNIQILCKSNAEIVVDGNCNLKVKGNSNESVDGNAVKTVKGNFYLNADGELILNGSQIHLNTAGKIAPENLAPELDITALDAALQNDEPDTDEGISAERYKELQERDGVEIKNETVEKDIQKAPEEPTIQPVPKSCENIPNDWNDSTPLTTNFTIGKLTKCVAGSGTVKAQNGLSEKEILCNLKQLAENCLEPLVEKYGKSKVQINSGLRNGSGKSQHDKGQAADVHLRGFSQDEFIEAMKWIRDNLPFDQIILERAKNFWIHISYKENGRRDVRTRVIGGGYPQGIHKII